METAELAGSALWRALKGLRVDDKQEGVQEGRLQALKTPE